MTEIYHQWFHDGSPLYDGKTSRYGPPPGYLVADQQVFSVDWIFRPTASPP